MTHEEETRNFLERPISDDAGDGLGFDDTFDDDYEDFEDDQQEGCCECGGEGFIVDDCFEDTCCCADPETEHGIIPCPHCNAGGSR